MNTWVLLALLCLVVLATSSFAEKAPGERNLKVDSEIVAANNDNKATGVFRVTNNGRDPVTIGKIIWDIRFSETVIYSGQMGSVHKDDIRQRFVTRKCGSKQLPMTLNPGAKLDCPFTSRENIYKGAITVSAAAVEAKAPDTFTGTYTAYDSLTLPDPRLTNLDDNKDPDCDPTPDAAAPATNQERLYKRACQVSIIGNDIDCGYRDSTGPKKFCKVCGGRAKIEEKCNYIKTCAAYSMEWNEDKTMYDCGYLKTYGGKERTNHYGWMTHYRVSGRP